MGVAPTGDPSQDAWPQGQEQLLKDRDLFYFFFHENWYTMFQTGFLFFLVIVIQNAWNKLISLLLYLLCRKSCP